MVHNSLVRDSLRRVAAGFFVLLLVQGLLLHRRLLFRRDFSVYAHQLTVLNPVLWDLTVLRRLWVNFLLGRLQSLGELGGLLCLLNDWRLGNAHFNLLFFFLVLLVVVLVFILL